MPGPDREWVVVEDGFEPSRQRSIETVLTVGNGRFATRGSLEEGHPGDRPATLAHGIFAPHPLAVTELANLPDWTAIDVVVRGQRFSLATGTTLVHRRLLDLRSAVLQREVTWRSPDGVTVELVFERFASLADTRLAAVRVAVTAVDFDGPVEVRARLNARAETDGLAHLEWRSQAAAAGEAELAVNVRGTNAHVGIAMRLRADRAPVEEAAWDVHEQPTLVARWDARRGEKASVEKVVALLTSREAEDPVGAARDALRGLPDGGFEALLAASAAAWRREWDVSDVIIEGDSEAQLAIRFSLYHLLIAAPRSDEDVSIGAKALAGFGYRGHAFWDTETFMLPFFIHVQPDIARNLLSYRYHRLDGARRKALAGGYEGAQFPWESADTGDEVTPTWLPDASGRELVRIWTGDIEIHVSAIIAHAVVTYWDATGDDEFMRQRGAEIVLETARFWASRAEWSEERRRYEFSDVIGPDEYHDHVDNNAFTNYMAAWHLGVAADVGEWLTKEDPDAAARILGPGEGAESTVRRFRHVAEQIYLPRDPRSGLVEQFDGYFQREDVDLGAYAGRTRSMQAILGIEGVAQTQVLKQPDVLMLAYLRPEVFSPADLQANYAYYNARTDHSYGSSLGPPIQALMAARMGDVDGAYEHFMRAARADLADVRGNAADGIHAASAGALWQAVVFGFAGVRFDGDRLTADPRLPGHWRRLAFRIIRRGKVIEVDLAGSTDRAEAEPAGQPEAPASGIRGLVFDLDGVITDTAESHYLGWQRLADEEGLPFDRAANEALRGISRRESLNRLLAGRQVSEAQAEEMMERKNRYYRQLIEDITPADVLPGARELVDEARQRGLKLAIGSASKNARDVLERLAIIDRFDAICDGHSVSRPKPAPDLFLAAAEALDLPPASCVVFEDAADGIAAAQAAGMPTVGIGPAERVGAADVVLESGLAGADLDSILGALAARRRAGVSA